MNWSPAAAFFFTVLLVLSSGLISRSHGYKQGYAEGYNQGMIDAVCHFEGNCRVTRRK